MSKSNDRVYNLTGRLSNDLTKIELKHSLIARRVLGTLSDKDLEIEIRQVRKTRSLSQNRFYWGVVVPLIQQHHQNQEGKNILTAEVHYYNLTQVLGYTFEQREIFGKICLVFQDEKSSSSMNTIEFMAFIKAIQEYYALMGLVIPDPNQTNFLNDF